MWPKIRLPGIDLAISSYHLLHSAWLQRFTPIGSIKLKSVLLFTALMHTGSQAEQAPPDPVALLQGVEAARAKVRSGRMEMRLVEAKPKLSNPGETIVRLNVSFEGVNRRMDQYQRSLFIDGGNPTTTAVNEKKLRAMGEDREAFVAAGLGHWKDTHVRSAYDGAQLMQYSEDLGAYVKDASKGTPDYVFDPRILGISTQYLISKTVPIFLAHHDAKSVSMVGAEELDGHRTWHVRVVGKNDQDRHFWIENSADFKVRKSESISRNSKSTVTARYLEDQTIGLPKWVELREYDRDDTLSRVVTITVEKAEYNVSVDPKQWTLAGLGMPLGEMVIDQRIHRVVGHFDGEGLTPQLPEAIRKGKAARWAPMYWALAVAGLAGLAVVAAVVVHRLNLLRREA